MACKRISLYKTSIPWDTQVWKGGDTQRVYRCLHRRALLARFQSVLVYASWQQGFQFVRHLWSFVLRLEDWLRDCSAVARWYDWNPDDRRIDERNELHGIHAKQRQDGSGKLLCHGLKARLALRRALFWGTTYRPWCLKQLRGLELLCRNRTRKGPNLQYASLIF